MSRYTYTLNTSEDRTRAMNVITAAPVGSRVDVKAPKRSVPQNDKMWAMLTEVAHQLPWHDMKLRPDDWKLIFLDALHRDLRIVPNLEGTGFINLSRSSSDLSKTEMADMIELMLAFGAKHGVKFADDVEAA